MTNPLVGHVILSQGHVLVGHMMFQMSKCHVIKHMTGQVIVSQGYVVEDWFVSHSCSLV